MVVPLYVLGCVDLCLIVVDETWHGACAWIDKTHLLLMTLNVLFVHFYCILAHFIVVLVREL